jgi:hypothetical protein
MDPISFIMVRINGQQHEVLYTFLSAVYSGIAPFDVTAQWSLDQKSVLISTIKDNATSTFNVLDMKKKTIRTLLHITSTQYEYYPLKWLDRTHVLVSAIGINQSKEEDIAPTRLYLLDVTARSVQGVRDLKLIVSGSQGGRLDIDTSPDGSRLYVVQQVQDNLTLWVEPVTGGKRQILLNLVGAHYFMDNMRVFTHYLLVTVQFSLLYHEIWRMPLDGSSHTVLFKSTDYTAYFLNRMTQYVSSDVSSDETMFAFETHNLGTAVSTLFVSPLSEAKATKFGAFPPEVRTSFIIGWTTT